MQLVVHLVSTCIGVCDLPRIEILQHFDKNIRWGLSKIGYTFTYDLFQGWLVVASEGCM